MAIGRYLGMSSQYPMSKIIEDYTKEYGIVDFEKNFAKEFDSIINATYDELGGSMSHKAAYAMGFARCYELMQRFMHRTDFKVV